MRAAVLPTAAQIEVPRPSLCGGRCRSRHADSVPVWAAVFYFPDFFFLVNSNPRFFVSVLNSCKALTHLSSESCRLNQNLSAFSELCGDEPPSQELHFPFPSLQVSTKNISFHTMTSYPLILRLRRCGRSYVTRN